jgi:hypothetical protein
MGGYLLAALAAFVSLLLELTTIREQKSALAQNREAET